MSDTDARIPEPPLNHPGIHRVPGALDHPDPRPPSTVLTGRHLLRGAQTSSFGRFLTVSLGLHAAILAAGITAGSAYQRRSGVEANQALVLFASVPEPITTSSDVTAVAEPERSVETTSPATEPEPMPTTSEEAVEMPLVPESELAAQAASASDPTTPTALDRAIGDPRESWRLPSSAVAGLQLGLESSPPVSDCCGEPQPGPPRPPAADVYVYPEVLEMAQAEFPEKSQRLGEQGSVLLEMNVGADGLVKEVRVVESSGHLRIDNCAVAAAWDWVFKPATRNGVPEASLARHRYTFRLMSARG